MEVGEPFVRATGVGDSHSRYRLPGPEVVHETVEEETIIVNLETGNYYDLNATGAHVFRSISALRSLDEIVQALCTEFEVDRDAAEADAEQLVGRLVEEQLIVPLEPGTAGMLVEERGAAPGRPESVEVRRPYAAPRLGKYTDMQELLLLDPVHEVDDAGWPSSA